MVLNFIFLLAEYCPFDISFTSIPFLITNFNTVDRLTIINIYFVLLFFLILLLILFSIPHLSSRRITISSTFLKIKLDSGFDFPVFHGFYFLLILLFLQLVYKLLIWRWMKTVRQFRLIIPRWSYYFDYIFPSVIRRQVLYSNMLIRSS